MKYAHDHDARPLNATPTVAGVRYTVIESRGDEVVTPYTNAFLPAASNVTNILLQNQCPLDATDHLEIAYDPIALADMLNALDPAHPVQAPRMVVLPLTGPVGLMLRAPVNSSSMRMVLLAGSYAALWRSYYALLRIDFATITRSLSTLSDSGRDLCRCDVIKHERTAG